MLLFLWKKVFAFSLNNTVSSYLLNFGFDPLFRWLQWLVSRDKCIFVNVSKIKLIETYFFFADKQDVIL